MELREILENYAVNCRTKQEVADFSTLSERLGYLFFKRTEGTSWWMAYKEETCFYVYKKCNEKLLFIGDMDILLKEGYKIITYRQMEDILTLSVDNIDLSLTVHKRKNKTVVKLPNGKVGVAKCHYKDIYNEGIGVILATMRAYSINIKDIVNSLSLKQKQEKQLQLVIYNCPKCKSVDPLLDKDTGRFLPLENEYSPKYKIGDKVLVKNASFAGAGEVIDVQISLDTEEVWYKVKETGEYGRQHSFRVQEKYLIGEWERRNG